MIFAIGPSISGNNYRINAKDVEKLIVQLIGQSYIKWNDFSVKLDENQLITLFKKDSIPDKLLFDIQACDILQLYREGINISQIILNRICTYSNPSIFNSFRRDHTKLRQWSCIYS